MKYEFLILISALLFSGCLKQSGGCNSDPNIVAPLSEQTEVENYLIANNISAVKNRAGFFYKIIEPGSGDNPNPCSTIKVNYTGYLTSGVQFEKNQLFLRLDVLIPGWIMSLPFIKKNGRIKIYLPPSLGYRDKEKRNDNGIVIPAYSILIYDITLIDFQ